MRILLINQHYLDEGDGGGSRFNRFVRHWAARGHRVTVLAGMVPSFTGRKDPAYRGRLFVRRRGPAGETVIRCFMPDWRARSRLGRMLGYAAFVLCVLLAGAVAGAGADVVLMSSPPLPAAPVAELLARLHGASFVFEVRDLWPEAIIQTGSLRGRAAIALAYAIERQAYRRADLVVAVTPAQQRALRQGKGVPGHKLVLLPNGADPDLMGPGPRDNAVRERLGLGDRFVVAYLGAHGPAQGLEQLLEAAGRLADCPDVAFLLVGDGPAKPDLVRRAAQRGLGNVVFADPVPKARVGECINAADACAAVLRRGEVYRTAWPNKIFDYMCCARPIVLAAGGVSRDLVEQAGAGLCVEPENAEALAGAVRALRADANLRRRLGESGRRFVLAHFDRQALAERYLRLLERVIAGKPGSRREHRPQPKPKNRGSGAQTNTRPAVGSCICRTAWTPGGAPGNQWNGTACSIDYLCP